MQARNFTDAIKKEATGEITDIWKEESVKQELTPAIGFDVGGEYEEDVDLDSKRHGNL